MAATIQIRRGLETNLPTLSQGELGFTTDTHKTYIGDGTTNYQFVNTADLLEYNRIDGSNYYPLGSTGTGTDAIWYLIATYTLSAQYAYVSEEWAILGRQEQFLKLTIDYEMGASAFSQEVFILKSDHGINNNQSFLAVTDDTNKTLKIYYNRTDIYDQCSFMIQMSNLRSSTVTRVISNIDSGTTMPTGDSDILQDNSNETILWTSRNDGSGTGLDADFLDGHHSTYFASTTDLNDYLPLVGGTLTGNLFLTTSAPRFHISGDDAEYKIIYFKTNNTARWYIGSNSTAETGSDDGSNFSINAYADSGASLGAALTIIRATKNSYFYGALFATKSVTVGSSGNGDSSIFFHDDNSNSYRSLQWDDSENDWRIEDNSSVYQKLWHGGNDGSGSGLDADLLDGYHAVDLINNKTTSVQLTSSSAIGWYTIATNTGNRAIARFAIRDITSSNHGETIFYASHKYGKDIADDITVLHHSQYGPLAYNQIRIKNYGTYDGAALQVYVSESTSNFVNAYMLGDNIQETGWVLKNWIPDATDPGDVDNWASFVQTSIVDLNLISDGGMIITGDDIYVGSQSSPSKVWTEGNDGSGSGLNADLLDGYHASYFSASTHTHAYLPLTGGILTGDLTVRADLFIGNDTGGDARILFYDDNNDTWRALIWDDSADDWMVEDNAGAMRNLWHSGNDGSGSGLDADLLDGVHASQLVRSDVDDVVSGDLNHYGAITYTQGSQCRVLSPVGGMFSGASTETGYIKITLPVSWSNTMLMFDVSIYDYSGNTNGESFKVTLGGYNYSSSSAWYNVFAHVQTVLDDRFYDVQFGHDGVHCAIYIGTAASTWSYPTVSVNNVVAGRTGTEADWADGWAVQVTTTLGTISKATTLKNVSNYSLDSDKLDGYQPATSATANTIALRDASGHLYGNYLFAQHCNLSHSTATRNTDTIFYSSTDNYIRKNNKAGFQKSIGITTWLIKTANYTAVSGDKIFCNTWNGAFTITLPASPTVGDTVIVADPAGGGGSWGSRNNLTVARNGQDIRGLAEDMICDVDNCTITFVYYNATDGWHFY